MKITIEKSKILCPCSTCADKQILFSLLPKWRIGGSNGGTWVFLWFFINIDFEDVQYPITNPIKEYLIWGFNLEEINHDPTR